jgi:hypothetical protein
MAEEMRIRLDLQPLDHVEESLAVSLLEDLGQLLDELFIGRESANRFRKHTRIGRSFEGRRRAGKIVAQEDAFLDTDPPTDIVASDLQGRAFEHRVESLWVLSAKGFEGGFERPLCGQ